MTSATVSTPVLAHDSVRKSSARKSSAPPHERTPRLTFAGVLRSERIKLASLRSIRVTLLLTLLGGLALSVLIAWAWSTEVGGPDSMLAADAVGLQTYLLMVSTFTAPFLALVFGVLGVFAVSSEYSSGMILSTLTAVPRRTPVFVAKAIVTAVLAAVTALVLVSGALVAAIAFLPESAAQLGSPIVISGVLGTVAYLVLFALLSFGISALLRSTAGGIAVVAGIAFVVPVALQVLMMTNWEWVPRVSMLLPAELGSVLSRGFVDAAPGGIGYWGALALMTAWAAVAVIPAAIAFKRRDAR
ncbi:MAG: ABC transporter permease subunit [Leucobacter sp.]